MSCSHCACTVSRDLCLEDQFFSHIFEIRDPDLPIHYNFYGAAIKTNAVTRQNSVWPCVKDHTALCVCAKFEVDRTIRCLVIALLLLVRYVTL